MLSSADNQAKRILQDVVASLASIRLLSGLTVYVFGSVLRNGAIWADIDVLLKVGQAEDVDCLRQALAPMAAATPLHVTIVLESEFRELGADAWGPLYQLMTR